MDSPAASAQTPAAMRDADLLALLARGQTAQAFERLVRRYEAKVYRLCWTLLRDQAAAQDAAQDSLLRVWRALDRFDAQKAALSTWIYAVARNRCLSLLAQTAPVTDSMSEPEVQAKVEGLAAPTAVPGSEQLLHRLDALVQALPAAQHQCLSLYYFEDRSVAEVSAMLGLPEGTVKTHLHRARSSLRATLQAQGLDDLNLWMD